MRAGGSAIETEVLQGVYSRGLFGAGAAAELLSLQQLARVEAKCQRVPRMPRCRARARERRRAARAGGNPEEARYRGSEKPENKKKRKPAKKEGKSKFWSPYLVCAICMLDV